MKKNLYVKIPITCAMSVIFTLHTYAEKFAIKNGLERPIFVRTSNTKTKQQHDFKSDWRTLKSGELYKTNNTVSYLTVSESEYPRYAQNIQHFKFPSRDKIYLAVEQKAGKLDLVPDNSIDGSPIGRNIEVKDVHYLPDLDIHYKVPLLQAIITGNATKTENIIGNKQLFKLLNTEIAYGWTPLHLAVYAGYINSDNPNYEHIIVDLIDNGTCLDSKTRSGLRPDDLLREKFIIDEKHSSTRNTDYVHGIFEHFEIERENRKGTTSQEQCNDRKN